MYDRRGWSCLYSRAGKAICAALILLPTPSFSECKIENVDGATVTIRYNSSTCQQNSKTQDGFAKQLQEEIEAFNIATQAPQHVRGKPSKPLRSAAQEKLYRFSEMRDSAQRMGGYFGQK